MTRPDQPTPLTGLPTTVTRELSCRRIADPTSTVRRRLAVVAAELRTEARRGETPDDILLQVARRLETI